MLTKELVKKLYLTGKYSHDQAVNFLVLAFGFDYQSAAEYLSF